MKKLTQKDKKEISRFRALFSDKIEVSAARAEEGGFVAEILTYPGCYTQGETFSELMCMVNDCLYTYFNIPEKYVPYMPEYLAPMSLAERLGIVPKRGVLKSIPYEKVAS
jgi:predicted RNase H-like HicB family nuclease